MKQYIVKPEYEDNWGGRNTECPITVTADEIAEMAAEWEMSVDELMEQVEEM